MEDDTGRGFAGEERGGEGLDDKVGTEVDDSIDIADIIDLIRISGALVRCDILVANLFTQARRNIVEAPHLSPEIRNAVSAIWKYMVALYDPDSEVSRLYLQARPSIQGGEDRVASPASAR